MLMLLAKPGSILLALLKYVKRKNAVRKIFKIYKD